MDSSTPKKNAFLISALFLLALVPRYFLLHEYKTDNPYYDAFLLDAEAYAEWIRHILDNGWMGQKVFYHAPLYPYLVAALFKFTGENYFFLFLIQTILSSISALLLYMAGNNFFNKKTGVIAALLFSFTDLFAFYSLKLLPVTLAVFLLLLLVLLFKKAEESEKYFYWGLCGAVTGLVSLARPNLLLLYPFFLLYFFLIYRVSSGGKLKTVLIYTTGFFLILGFSLFHNYLAAKDTVFISANGGETFYHGNNINASGTYAFPPEITPSLKFQNRDAKNAAEKELGRELKQSEVSRFWYQKGLDFILGDPWRYGLLELKKLRLIFSGLDTSIIYHMDFEEKEFTPELKLFFINYAAILPLALCGLWVCRTEWRRHFILISIIGVHGATLLVFYVTTRYRLPMVPFLILFGARAIAAIPPRFYSNAFFYVLSALLFFSLLVNRWEVPRHQPNKSDLYCNLGYTLIDEGKFDQAFKIFKKARELDKKSVRPFLGLISYYANIGAVKRAFKFYKMVYPMMRPRMAKETLRDPALAPIHREIADFLKEKGL